MTPRRAKRSPRRAKVSSGRLPGAFWAGFPKHFQATRRDRDAPNSNRRRGRVAPEQGYRLALGLACLRSLPRDRARKLRKRRTRNSRLCLVVLCLGSSRRCLCSSPCPLRRLRCLRLSLFTRFPFLDSQVTGSARDACISRGALGVGACRDPSAAIEVSLGGLPPKGGGSEAVSYTHLTLPTKRIV